MVVWWFGGLVSWRWARCALHMQRAGNEASVGECLRQSATSESVAAVGRAQRCSGKRARVMGSNYGRRRRCSGRGWRCEVSWRSAADEIGPHFWWLAKGTERGIGIVFGCCFARQRIIRTSTRCPSTIRRRCAALWAIVHTQFPARSQPIPGPAAWANDCVWGCFCFARSPPPCSLPLHAHSTRAAVQKERTDSAGRGVWLFQNLAALVRAQIALYASQHTYPRTPRLGPSHPLLHSARAEGRGEDRTQCTHARTQHTHTHNTSCPPASRLLAHTCALLAHCAPTAQALSPHRRNNMWSITHHAPDR
jgi:hypothetical protein